MKSFIRFTGVIFLTLLFVLTSAGTSAQGPIVSAAVEKQITTDGSANVIVFLKPLGSVAPRTPYDPRSTRTANVARVNQALNNALNGQSPAIQSLSSPDVRVTRTLKILDGRAFAAQINRAGLQKLQADSRVEKVLADEIIKLEPNISGSGPDLWNLAKIRAPEAQTISKGSGVVCATTDTGIDPTHPEFAGRIVGFYDAINHQPVAYDDNGHGTHTAGTMAGKTYGVAPECQILVAKAFDAFGGGQTSSILDAWSWLMAPGGDPGKAPQVINNSWGTNDGSNEVFRPAVDNLLAAGILPVFAAGNAGPSSGSVGSPASYPEAYAVGATDAADLVAYFSSRGPSPIGGVFKPEVCAPGVDVKSSWPGGGSMILSGTSMATPHVTGLAALLLQLDHSISPVAIANLINKTGVGIYPPKGSNNICDFGRIDALSAVLEIPTGTVTFDVKKDTGGFLGDVTISLSNGQKVLSNDTKPVQIKMGPGTYTGVANAFFYKQKSFNPSPFTVIVGKDTLVNIVMTLKIQGILTGTMIAGDTGKPLSGKVSLEGTPVSVVVGADGKFFLMAPEDVYTIVGEPDDKRYIIIRQGVTIKNGQPKEVVLKLDHYPSLPFKDGVGGASLVPDAGTLWHLVNQSDDCAASAMNNGVPARAWYYGHRESNGKCDYDTGVKNSGSVRTPWLYIPTETVSPSLKYDWWKYTEYSDFFDTVSVVLTKIDGSRVTLVMHGRDNLAQWNRANIDLTAYVGQAVQIEWLFDTVDPFGNNFRGFYLTNVILAGKTAQLVTTAEVPAQALPRDSFEIPLTLKNIGELDAINTVLTIGWDGPAGITSQAQANLRNAGWKSSSSLLWSLNLGNLAAGGVVSLKLPMTINSSAKDGQKVHFFAKATTDTAQEDPGLGNFEADVKVVTAELVLTATGPASVGNCENIGASAKVENKGGVTAENVVVTATVSSKNTLTLCPSSNVRTIKRTDAGFQIVFNVGKLASGSSQEAKLDMSLSAAPDTEVVITFDATTTTIESYPDNKTTRKLTIGPATKNIIYLPFVGKGSGGK